MLTITHVSKSSMTGRWQAFARKPNGNEAILYAGSRADVVQEAVRWIGEGSPENTLAAALEALESVLGGQPWLT